MSRTISIRYFALLRDLAGLSEERVTIARDATASQIYLRMAEKYAFPLRLADVRLAVNDDFVITDHRLNDGDALAFIPPVSGG